MKKTVKLLLLVTSFLLLISSTGCRSIKEPPRYGTQPVRTSIKKEKINKIILNNESTIIQAGI